MNRLEVKKIKSVPTDHEDILHHQQTLYTSSNLTRRWLHLSRRDWIMSAIRRHAPERRSRAIEVGPGSGIYLPVLLGIFDSVTAIDVEERFLEAARKLSDNNRALTVQRGDITEHATLSCGVHDLVLCTEVIEHVPRNKSDAAFAGLRKIMSDDGILVLSTPHRWSSVESIARIMLSPLLIWLTRMIYDESITELGHINLLTREQVRRSLQRSGFKIVEEHASGLYIPIVAEFFGAMGLSLEQWLEPKLRGSIFHQILWTQYYVVTASVRQKQEGI